ncbi:MAG TPA: LysR family transcriptional regulator [Clostridiaceae bacterium]
MNIKQLTYFLTIVEEGTILKASKKLHIAQPPLSQQLKLLEEELGCILIERTTRKSQITDTGKKLYNGAKKILELIDTTTKEVRDVKEGLQGSLSIGTVSALGASFLPERFSSFHQKYPGIKFDIYDENTNKIIELLEQGLIDIGIIRTPFNLDKFEAIILPDVPMIAVSRNLEVEKVCENIRLSDLINMPLIVQQRYEKTIVELCFKEGLTPNIFCRSNDVRTILLWAAAGMGTAIVPKDCLHLINDINVEHKEIRETSLNIGTAIIWTRNCYLTAVARHFLDGITTIST